MAVTCNNAMDVQPKDFYSVGNKHKMIHPVGSWANRMISEFTGFHPVPDKLQDDFWFLNLIFIFPLKLVQLTKTNNPDSHHWTIFLFVDVALRAAWISKNRYFLGNKRMSFLLMLPCGRPRSWKITFCCICLCPRSVKTVLFEWIWASRVWWNLRFWKMLQIALVNVSNGPLAPKLWLFLL